MRPPATARSIASDVERDEAHLLDTGVARQRRADLGLRVPRHGARPQPVDDHQRLHAGDGLLELGQAADEPLQPDGVGAADGDDRVGGGEHGQGGAVAARRRRVVGQLLVLLEGEGAVDDRRGHERPGELEDHLQRGRAQLGPPVGAGRAGQQAQVGRDRAREAGERRQVQGALVGQAGGCGKARRLVEQAQHLGDDPAVDVGVDEQRPTAETGQLAGEVDGDGRAPRGTGGSPDGDHLTGPERARRARLVGGAGRQRCSRVGVGDASRRGGLLGGADRQHHRVGQLLGRGVRRQHVGDAEGPQAPLGLVVARWRQPDDRDPGDGEPGERRPVEAPQVGRQQDRAGLAGRGGREQVREVDAAPDDGDAEVVALERDDQLGLPDGVRHRREHRDRH